MFSMAVGATGALAGGLSAYWWVRAAHVLPVYNSSALQGLGGEEKKRTDRHASLNARAAIATAVATGCHGIVLALGVLLI